MNDTLEFNTWNNEVPVIIPTSELDFNIWENDVPVIEVVESAVVTIVRRRAAIF